MRDRLLGWRDRLLASRRFQRWAAAFPLTRPIARNRARALFDLCAGFVYSQVLLAAIRLELFDKLAEGPQTAARLSDRMGLPEEGGRQLLDAAVSLGLAERRAGGRYGLGMLGAALLGNPGIAEMVGHHPLLYRDLEDPVALLKSRPDSTALGRYWPYAETESPTALGEEDVAAYSALMHASQGFIANDVLDAYPVAKHRRLLDVGGGEGRFLMEAAMRSPALELRLFDLPAVAERAQARFAAAGLAHRAEAAGGDFRTDPLPEGADLITLVRILHDHDDATVLDLLRNVRRAMPADGTLLIAEPMAGTAGAEPIGDAYFAFYLRAMGRGRPRTPEAISDLLARAGFSTGRLLATRRPLLVRLMRARP